ncbi:MAG: ABC-2 transporter permease [Eubacteriales bacterium]
MTRSLRITKLDFYTMKSQFAMYLILAMIVLLFAFMGSSAIVLSITCSWFVALMSSNIFAIQEKDNLNRLYGSLSVNLKDVVLGRYIFIFLNYIISFFMIIVLYFGFVLFQNEEMNLQEVLLGFSLSFLIFSVIVGMQMPIFFKMGYTKAKIWSLLPFLAVMALVIIPSFVDALSGIVEFMMSNKIVLIISAILASCIIQFISYNISVVTYRRGR